MFVLGNPTHTPRPPRLAAAAASSATHEDSAKSRGVCSTESCFGIIPSSAIHPPYLAQAWRHIPAPRLRAPANEQRRFLTRLPPLPPKRQDSQFETLPPPPPSTRLLTLRVFVHNLKLCRGVADRLTEVHDPRDPKTFYWRGGALMRSAWRSHRHTVVVVVA